MATLKVPSLQHLARNWRDDADLVRRSLVQLALHSPQFSYDPLFAAIRDLLVLGVPYEQIEDGIKKGVKRSFVQPILLEVLPLIRDHFNGIVPDFPPQEVSPRPYRSHATCAFRSSRRCSTALAGSSICRGSASGVAIRWRGGGYRCS
jgi:hypothetical protein